MPVLGLFLVVCVAEVKYFNYLRAHGTHQGTEICEDSEAVQNLHQNWCSLVRAAEGLYQAGMDVGLTVPAAQHEQKNQTSVF